MRAIDPRLLPATLACVREYTGFSYTQAETCYHRWQREAKPAPCLKYGKEKPIAVDCRCAGCLDSLASLYFDTVAAKFAAALTPHAKGFS